MKNRERSDISIDHGREFNALSRNQNTAVVLIGMTFPPAQPGGRTLASSCSATKVSDNTLITAAHCVSRFARNADGSVNGKVCIRSGNLDGTCSSSLYIPQEYRADNPLRYAFDVAVAIFPRGTFKDYHLLETRKPVTDWRLVLSGWSAFVDGEDLDLLPTNRWGRSTISRFISDITIVSEGNGSADGVAVSPGDSGGPALYQCRLVGVASRMNIVERFKPIAGTNLAQVVEVKESLHTNMTYSGVTNFFASLAAKGAYICGFHGTDASFCPAGRNFVQINGEQAEKGDIYPCVLASTQPSDSLPPQNPGTNNQVPTPNNQTPPSAPINQPPPTPQAPDPNDGKCACGVAPNKFGQGCVIERVSAKAGQTKILVQSGSGKMCETEAHCRSNFGDYLNSPQYCPAGWFFGKVSDLPVR
jgi:hypothetical protein